MNEGNFLHYDDKTSKIIIKNNKDKQELLLKITNLKLDVYDLEDIINKQLNSFNFIPQEINQSNFLKVYEKLIGKKKEKFSLHSESIYIDGNLLILEKKSINYIVKIIKCLIGNINHDNETERKIYNFAFLGIIPKIEAGNTFMGEDIQTILENFNCVQTLKIQIYNKQNYKNEIEYSYRNDIKINKVMLVSYFFNTLFPNISSIDIDLNIIPINEKFFGFKNDFNEKTINNLSENYKDLFITNLLILNMFYSRNNIFKGKIKIFDSYQLELQHIFSKEYFTSNQLIRASNYICSIEKNINREGNINLNYMSDKEENISNYAKELNNTIIYFDNLIISTKENNFLQLDLHFNSLDPLLFEKINSVILTLKNLSNLKLSLFPDSHISLYKLLINQNFYNYYKGETNLVLFNKNQNLNNKVMSKLFRNFNVNLENLFIILEPKIFHQELSSILIDFSTYYYFELHNYDNFNSAIASFIFNLLISFQKGCKKKLNYFHLIMDDTNNVKISLIKKLLIKYNNKQKISLKNLNLSILCLDINNISSIISFVDLPYSLNQLTINQISEEDLDNVINLLSQINNHKLLHILNISLDEKLMIIPFEKLKRFLSIINKQLEEVSISFPIELSFKEIYDFFYTIKLNGNFSTLIIFKYYSSFFNFYSKKTLNEQLNEIKGIINKNNSIFSKIKVNIKLNLIIIDIFVVKKEFHFKAISLIKAFKTLFGTKFNNEYLLRILIYLNMTQKKTIQISIQKH